MSTNHCFLTFTFFHCQGDISITYPKHAAVSLENTFNRSVSFRFLSFPLSEVSWYLVCFALLAWLWLWVISYHPNGWDSMKPSIVLVKATAPCILGTNFDLPSALVKTLQQWCFPIFLINSSNGNGTGSGLRSDHDISDDCEVSALAIHWAEDNPSCKPSLPRWTTKPAADPEIFAIASELLRLSGSC